MPEEPKKTIDALSIIVHCARGIDAVKKALSDTRIGKNSSELELILVFASSQIVDSKNARSELGIKELKLVFSELEYPAARRNAGIEAASKSHLVFLDDDVKCGKSFIDDVLEAVNRRPREILQPAPYLAANSENWLSRCESQNYREGFQRYLRPNGDVTILDARILVVQHLRSDQSNLTNR